jgi:hypothetical protein
MEVGLADNTRPAIKIGNNNFKNVTSFKYLGVEVNNKGLCLMK